MDIVTHGLAGGLVARAVAQRAPWPVVAATLGGALAPDLDVLARLWDPLAAITVHRTATHSLVGGLPLAAGVAGVLRPWWSGPSVWSLAIFAYLGVLSHIGLDLLTPFGTAALWPFETRRFGLGWLYVIDPVVLGVVLVGLFVAFGSAGYGALGARGALVALAAYVVVAGTMHRAAEGEFHRLLDGQGVAPARAAVVPVFPGPLRWLGVAETEGALYRSRFWLGRRGNEALAMFPKTAADGHPGLEGLPEVKAFRAFARFPWLTVVSDGSARLVEYRDLAFEDHPWGGPMALRLRLDRSGAVRAVELGHKL